MQVQEFDDLVDWVKNNILDSYDSGDSDNVPELDVYDIEDARSNRIAPVDDYLSLLEFIIGIDD